MKWHDYVPRYDKPSILWLYKPLLLQPDGLLIVRKQQSFGVSKLSGAVRRMTEKCLKGVEKISRRCLEYVWKVSLSCFKVSWMFLDRFWKCLGCCHTRVQLENFSSASNLAILQVGPQIGIIMYLRHLPIIFKTPSRYISQTFYTRFSHPPDSSRQIPYPKRLFFYKISVICRVRGARAHYQKIKGLSYLLGTVYKLFESFWKVSESV